MQVSLFKALQSVNINDTLATAVVDQLEDYVATKIADATKNLEAQNKGLEAQNKGLEAQIKGLSESIGAMRWQIGLIGTLIVIVGLANAAGPVIAKLIH